MSRNSYTNSKERRIPIIQRHLDTIDVFIQHGNQMLRQASQHYPRRSGLRRAVQELIELGIICAVDKVPFVKDAQQGALHDVCVYGIVNKTEAYAYACELIAEQERLVGKGKGDAKR